MTAKQPRPEPDLVLIFDGGSLGNPGRGYGSYRLTGRDFPTRLLRLEFGNRVTNNEAEYRALIAGLEDALAILRAAGRPPEQARVCVFGDSQLVINQLAGGWRVRSETLRPLYQRARELLERFGEVSLHWHPRARSVEVLGH